MKARTAFRWMATGLAAALMVLSAIPDVLRVAGAVSVFGHLGYPRYLLPFLGTAKMLGVAVVLAPRLRRLKEWAFAGLTFDVVGALYSHLSIFSYNTFGELASTGAAIIVGVADANGVAVLAPRADQRN